MTVALPQVPCYVATLSPAEYRRDIHGDVIRLRPELAKNKDGRVIILVGEVANIIDRRRAERVESCPYVFHRQGQQFIDYSRAWGKRENSLGCRNAYAMI